MKHVIVITTADAPEGPEIHPMLAHYIESRIEKALLNIAEMDCFIQSRFNVDSAIEATHEMYNAPKWNGGETWRDLVNSLKQLLKYCPLSGDLALMVRCMQSGGEENNKRATTLVEHYQHLDEAQDAAREALIEAGEPS